MQNSEKYHILHCSVFEGKKLRTLVADPDLSISWTTWIISITWSILTFTLSRGVSRDLFQPHWTCVSGMFLGQATNRCEMWKNTGDLQRVLVLLQSALKKTAKLIIAILRSEFPLILTKEWEIYADKLETWVTVSGHLSASLKSIFISPSSRHSLYPKKSSLDCLKLQP